MKRCFAIRWSKHSAKTEQYNRITHYELCEAMVPPNVAAN